MPFGERLPGAQLQTPGEQRRHEEEEEEEEGGGCGVGVQAAEPPS